MCVRLHVSEWHREGVSTRVSVCACAKLIAKVFASITPTAEIQSKGVILYMTFATDYWCLSWMGSQWLWTDAKLIYVLCSMFESR